MDKGLVHCTLCLFAPQLYWYSLHLPTEGWPGWVNLLETVPRWFTRHRQLPTTAPSPDHYLDNSTSFQYTNASSTRQQCWRIDWTRLVSRPTWRNTSFNAFHLVRPAQLHHRYYLYRDWPPSSQDVHSTMAHLSSGTVWLQKFCCAIWNIVLKDILKVYSSQKNELAKTILAV